MSALANINAAVLVGGLGTRLRSVVADRPKPLAEVSGRPFVAYLLDQLASAGVGRAVLCAGHLGEQVAAALGDAHRGMRLDYSLEPVPLGTGGALRLAAERIESDEVLVLNGDSYCEANFAAFVAVAHARGAQAAMVLARVDDTAAYGQVELNDEGWITRFREKGRRQGPGLINAGIYLLARRRVLSIPPSQPASLERDLFPGWVAEGMLGWTGGGRFLDIGTPASLAAAAAFFDELRRGG